MKAALLFLLFASLASAAPLSVTLNPPPTASPQPFALGTARAPDGTTITLDQTSLLLDGERWTPALGEFHYSRYPADEWREELLKMKAGGIDVVATYVFWIHHEETEGAWNWSGSRDLRRFVETARDVGLRVIVRCGPWCHGEVRNGGLPDWVVARGHVRSDDPGYLALATALYQQIAAQLRGLLWKDGGPVIGIQLENEYGGPAAHLLTLKKIARDAGLDVPLYTRTGWPALKTPMPFGEILPLYGVYAEGFWDRELTSMPGHYWAGFRFSTLRTDANIANEALGRRDAQDAPDVARYPYLTCEIGGGMMSSYHRRIRVDPRDIVSTTLVKLGSGSNSPGYYMYHGGTNPEGRTPLMENQSTAITNWNDLPEKNYDFQAPLGQYGQIRPQYHLLRRLHYFLRECGSDLAALPVALPDVRPAGRDDVATLRWSVRSDGHRGFVFVNNHERGRLLPAKPGVQFSLRPPTGEPLVFPAQPITVPTGAAFIWPFNLPIAGATLVYATAQPITHIVDGQTRTVFFAATPDIPAEFAFDARDTEIISTSGQLTRSGDRLVIRGLPTGRDVAITAQTKSGRPLQIVVLDEPDSLALWKGAWHGRPRAVLTPDAVVFDRDALRVTAVGSAPHELAVFPAPGHLPYPEQPDGIFRRFALPADGTTPPAPRVTLVRPAGPPRHIALGAAPQPVAAAPTDADFTAAAVWRIEVPAGLDLSTNPLLRLHYTGDVARVLIGDDVIMDDFYNGDVLEIGLRRHAAALKDGALTVALLPLQKSAPISYPASALPAADLTAELTRAELIPRPNFSL